jgi:hypothetical protein
MWVIRHLYRILGETDNIWLDLKRILVLRITLHFCMTRIIFPQVCALKMSRLFPYRIYPQEKRGYQQCPLRETVAGIFPQKRTNMLIIPGDRYCIPGNSAR